jgi:hypothetical protein
MSKVNRYYVDSEGNEKCDIAIRDRLSPMGKSRFPNDIAVQVTMGMFSSRTQTITVADKICEILNEEF